MAMHHEYCMEHYDYLKNPPKFVIYIGMNTCSDMKDEIVGYQAPFLVEAYYDDTILGFPVYRTIDHNGWKIYRDE